MFQIKLCTHIYKVLQTLPVFERNWQTVMRFIFVITDFIIIIFLMDIACIGSWGKECTKNCTYGYYGHGCRRICKCNRREKCDSKHGCVEIGKYKKKKIAESCTIQHYRGLEGKKHNKLHKPYSPFWGHQVCIQLQIVRVRGFYRPSVRL